MIGQRMWGRSPAAPTLALVVALAGVAGAQEPPDSASISPAEARLRADVAYLADDAREGRAPGTPGIEAAADYIAAIFRELGLKTAPGADGYFQPFALSGNAKLAGTPTLAAAGPDGAAIKAEPGDDFSPLAIGGSAALKGTPVVFAGYGISVKDDEAGLDYDDYAGVDVKGKVVLILRRTPRQDVKDGPFARRTMRIGTFRHKATNAFQQGAAAVILVNDAATVEQAEGKDKPLRFEEAGRDQNSTIPFVFATRAFADELLAAAGAPKLAELEAEIDADGKPHSRALEGVKVDAAFEVERTSVTTRNVVGVLEGSGPTADETIVVGGHYDHLGRGGMMSGSLAFLSRDIHNGADDNASGTALVIELARRLSKRPDPLPRRVVFMLFSGEEKGLLGSQYYVENPLYPLGQTVMMLNFDMVGRLNDEQELTFFGIGSTPGVGEMVEALGTAAGFKVKKVGGMSDGMGGSDHQSFYAKNIPVLFAFTGVHKDYHRPSDDVEKINYKGMARIADLAELILLEIARRPKRPEFTRVQPPRRGGQAANAEANPHGEGDPGRLSVGAYLGTIPSYDDDAKGVKLQGVREGSPAEKGGIKGGDVIVGFGGKPVATIYDYTESLGRYKAGDEVEVVVKRDGKEETLKVTLGSRPGN